VNPIRLIVLDLDGTMVDTFDDIAMATNYALEHLGRTTQPVPTIKSYVGHGARNLMRRVLGPDAPDDEVARGFELWKEYYTLHPADLSRPYPGVLETLPLLRDQGFRLVALSNKVHSITVAIADALGLASLLDAVYGERDGVPRKPAPEALLPIIEAFGATPETTLLVGDGDADMELARATGCRVVGVAYGVTPPERLRELGALEVFDEFRELAEWAERNTV
jgi:phosphoglycolate phosphatase